VRHLRSIAEPVIRNGHAIRRPVILRGIVAVRSR
jgi:hypothetical protein